MSAFIQDYKKLKQARNDVKQEKKRLEEVRESITANCDAGVFSDNLTKMHMFVQEARDSGNNPDVIRDGFIKYRAVSCFYRWVYNIGRHDENGYWPDYVDVVGPVACVNVDQKGCSFDEEACAGCEHFAGLIEYQSQKAQFEKSVEKRKKAKQQLLSHFWIKRIK